MMFLLLFTNEAKLYVSELIQYWFETLTSIVVMSVVFIGLFMGIKTFAPGADNESLEGLIFGYLIWNFATSVYNAVAANVSEDNQKGIIEQIYLSPAGFIQVMLARTVVYTVWGILMSVLLTTIAMALTGTWLSINLPYLYAILLLAAPALIGIGFIMSGLALLFKKVSTIAALMNIAFIGLVSISTTPWQLFSLLPFSAGASLARQTVLHHQPLVLTDLTFVVVNGMIYFLVGLFLYQKLEQRAKHLNLIGQY